MQDMNNAIRQELQEAVLDLLVCPDCPFSEEELLAKYLELCKEENVTWIRGLLSFLTEGQKGKGGEK